MSESFSAVEEMTGIWKCLAYFVLPVSAQSFLNWCMVLGGHLDFLLPEACLMGDSPVVFLPSAFLLRDIFCSHLTFTTRIVSQIKPQ